MQTFIDIAARCSRLVMQTEVVTIASMMLSPFLSIVFIPRREVAVGIETQVIAHMTLVVVCVDVHLDILEDSLTCGAGYTNHFDGVAALGLDTDKLCESLHESCTEVFWDTLVRASAHCFLLLFADSPTPAAERVRRTLAARMQNLVCLPYEPYTQTEFAAILQTRLQDKGVPCPDSSTLSALVKKAHTTTMPQLDSLEKQLILSACSAAPVPKKKTRLYKNV